MAKRATTTSPIGNNPSVRSGEWGVRSEHAELRTPNSELTRRRQGLTLIEVLLSLAILGIGEVVILQALARGAHAMAAAERRSAAYAFAAAQLAVVVSSACSEPK